MTLSFPIKITISFGLIYAGTVMYTIAAYYHLKFKGKQWSFLLAFVLAMPLVVMEYALSLHGNHFANEWLGISAMKILILTMCFYFINLAILNYFVLKHKVDVVREMIAFVLIILAFIISRVYTED